ncbi:MAG: alpha/beta fold hydrolase, partial [Synechocystis sp.]|nr:alpha/beta fold hydrolase [Synechocystis sp.]
PMGTNVQKTPWTDRIGFQRDWIWRGWQIRYSFRHPPQPSPLPPLLLIHGFGAAIEHWRYNIPVLSQHTSVYAIDLLGFGGSRKANTPYSAYDWGQQLIDFCQEIIGRPTVLVGNSIGSLAALTAANQSPDWITGLIMASLPDVSIRQQSLSPSFRPWLEKIENALAPPWLLNTIFNFVRRPPVIEKWAGLAYGTCQERPNQAKIDPELVQIIARPPQDADAENAFQQLFHSVRQPQFAPTAQDILPKLTIPMLLLWGDQDRFIPCRFGQAFAALNPRLAFQLWPGAGHCLQDECPERFNQTCLQWLQQNFVEEH